MSKINLNDFSFTQRLPFNTPQGSYPYAFIDRNSKKLVITIGDSWTWGADLTVNDDLLVRLQKSYGGVISQQLTADYLNLGQCGSCNLHITERIKEISNIELDYDCVYVICTFTEVARSLNGPYDKNTDYVKWFSTHSIDDFLNFHNSINTNYLQAIPSNVKLITGCNFVDPIGINTTLKKTWVELYNEKTTQLEYKKPCYILSPWVLDKLKPFIEEFTPNVDRIYLLEWLMSLADAASKRKMLLSNSLYYAGANHPTILGHKIWADYILENLNE